MKNNKTHRLLISTLLPIALLFLLFTQWQTIHQIFGNQQNAAAITKATNSKATIEKKQKGAHVFRIKDSTNFDFLDRMNIEWITVVNWGYQEAYDSPLVTHHHGDSLLMLKRDSSWLKRLQLIRSKGYKVFVKPHIWLHRPSTGKWRSDIFPTSDENWELWKKSYRDFILRYAKLAEQANAEMFCIGTELTKVAVEKPVFWKTLIQEVRGVYAGKITYAANWYKEYEQITFWEDLDYIGIQAYFPLVKEEYPSVRQISKGWKKYLPAMKSIHKKYKRPILFTEMGYKSTADSAIEPWEWLENTSGKSLSLETQANCYEAFFKTVWDKEWFEGVHIWQLRSDFVAGRGKSNLDFTPQGKPTENIIAKGFE